ncbi:hypothetical protein AA0111_g2645 [Alternaria arborescens]|uniref:hypothetical protein n=1 Tax=Alternaria arborescens TaxID=156630 RepID=UPI0010751317|nr:hypothetical protein AA0111_g2645 [Alternaria arborescens]RYO38006.1 hypothetical protein AA0111_g2645 [Alternaria arborescens]
MTYCPTRLLEIDQPEANKLRLRLCSELDNTLLQYATLSHCWGTSKTLRLTSDSFQRFRDGVDVSELAKTFQDAVFAAKSLGIKLLWIDSFCIFQDSKEDWQQEAALMSQVYRHSFLNIAASIAVDSDAGCFRERVSTAERYLIQTTWTDYPNDTYYLYNMNYWADNFISTPLKKRAWVVQELALAPRALHLCGDQLFWECHGLDACETWPTGPPPNMWVSHAELRSYSASIEVFGFPRTDDSESVYISTDENDKLNTTTFRELWKHIVSNYNMCDLTFPSDKLVALSGIAKHMEQLLKIDYWAGLWAFDLIPELIWYIREPSIPNPEADTIVYRAPSWSWACMDGEVDWIAWRGQFLVDIVCCDIRTATADRTGAVISAALQLSGWLATIEIRPRPKGWDVYINGRWSSLGGAHVYLDRPLAWSQLHCLPLEDHGLLNTLLLIPTGVTRGQFQRVGIAVMGIGTFGQEDCDQLAHVTNESWLEYEAIGDDGKCTITIV